MRTRVQTGRVRGYQPTLSEFNELLELAQRGIDAPDATAELYYQRGSNVTTSDKGVSKITAEQLSKLIEESGESKNLANLKFSSSQDSQARSVNLNIDTDGWVYYTVESSDFTWALGRFHELTEALLDKRRLPAKARFPLPEILTSRQSYMAWGGALWLPLRDWRITLVNMFRESPVAIIPLILLSFAFVRPSFSVAGEIVVAGLALAYAAILFGYDHWLRETYRSYVSIARPRLGIISVIFDKEADPASRGILLFTIVGVVVGILTLIYALLR
jgi:hypothetical protein